MFGISIFESPEHFIALYLSLFSQPNKSVPHLQTLLTRTKNPPISALYTHEFLIEKSSEEHSLDIIRYLSQLSDLSSGVSMSSSLQGVINESSFLTEIRHNLAHKVKINNHLIKVAKDLIIRELTSKYWDASFERYMETYSIDINIISKEYEKIYEDTLSMELIHKVKSAMRVVSAEWLKETSNYEFKEFFPVFFNDHSESECLGLLGDLSSHKKAIAVSYAIRVFCLKNKEEKLCQFLIKIFKKEPSILTENLVYRNLKKLSFVHYLGLCSKAIKSLPEKIQNDLASYWQKKENELQKTNACFKILKMFNKHVE